MQTNEKQGASNAPIIWEISHADNVEASTKDSPMPSSNANEEGKFWFNNDRSIHFSHVTRKCVVIWWDAAFSPHQEPLLKQEEIT